MLFLIIALLIVTINFFFLKQRIVVIKKSRHLGTYSNSLTNHYLYCFIIWSIALAGIIIGAFANLELLKQIYLLLIGLVICSILTIILFKKSFNAKKHLELITKFLLIISTTTGVVITFLITISILFEAIKFFKIVNPLEFLFGLTWNPQIAVHSEQGVSSGSFGIIPVLTGTLLITFIALFIAIPIGLMSAIYLSEYASTKIRNFLKPVLEILAGVPTVVYGYFAAITIGPFLKDLFGSFNMPISSESALAAGLVMGIMIVPFILSLSDDAINAVPTSLKDAALALGSTKSETIKKVVLVAAFPNIISAILLAFSRAIGETMIVVMAAGLVAKLTFNPLESVTTATAQIVSLLVGDQDANSPQTLAAFALGLALFVITVIFNIIALITVKKYSKR